MSVNDQVKRLASNQPPITDPDLFARECAEALRSHRRSDITVAVIFGILSVVGVATGTEGTVKFSGFLLLLTGSLLGRNLVTRDSLRKALTAQYPDAALKAGISASSKDADVPSYARKK